MHSLRLNPSAPLLACAVSLVALLQPSPLTAQDAAAEGSAGVETTPRDGFSFGTYGRIVAGSDLEGGRGKRVQVASFAPRLIEDPYLETDFRYRLSADSGAQFETLLTLAFTEALFHFDGDFDGAVAIRNAWVGARNFGLDGLSAWAGSRMLRGDDIYLLDFWPLDDLNTVGGGLRFEAPTHTVVSAHAGVNQLANNFQYQEVQVAGPTFGTESLILLDRVRTLASVKVEQFLLDLGGSTQLKFVAYGDYQRLGDGVYENDDEVRIELPDDSGWSVGAQVGAWGFTPNGFANVFFRSSGGLAAYDELAVPTGVDRQRRVTSARLTRVGASFNAETRWVGVTGGTYVQWFHDADDVAFDRDDYWEGVFALRPVIFATRHFHQAFELSYQHRRPDGLSARTDSFLTPSAWQFGVMPTLSLDRGVYSRPQLRVIYALTLADQGARDLYPSGDPRAERSTQHYLGVGAEWWFNSSTRD